MLYQNKYNLRIGRKVNWLSNHTLKFMTHWAGIQQLKKLRSHWVSEYILRDNTENHYLSQTWTPQELNVIFIHRKQGKFDITNRWNNIIVQLTELRSVDEEMHKVHFSNENKRLFHGELHQRLRGIFHFLITEITYRHQFERTAKPKRIFETKR